MLRLVCGFRWYFKVQKYIKYTQYAEVYKICKVFVIIFNKTVEQNERNLSLCVLFLWLFVKIRICIKPILYNCMNVSFSVSPFPEYLNLRFKNSFEPYNEIRKVTRNDSYFYGQKRRNESWKNLLYDKHSIWIFHTHTCTFNLYIFINIFYGPFTINFCYE